VVFGVELTFLPFKPRLPRVGDVAPRVGIVVIAVSFMVLYDSMSGRTGDFLVYSRNCGRGQVTAAARAAGYWSNFVQLT